jgi:methionine-rich copper-binding protein CopC
MKTWLRHSMMAAAATSALAFAACSDDDNNGPSGPDTTGPTVASVTSVDANHVNVRFGEEVDRTSAEDEGNYSIVETSVSQLADVRLAPGDPIPVTNASLRDDGRTVMLTTGTSMSTTGYRVIVNNVEDVNGNEVENGTEKEFAGSSTPDQTAPEIIHKEPPANATNVSRSEPIVIEFSEPLEPLNFNNAFTLTTSGTPEVPVEITSEDNVHFTVTPTSALGSGKLYTVSLVGVQDATGNTMTNTEWSFHTASTTDNTPPHLVSSVPANHATGVATSSTISMTFSEPIDAESFSASVTPTVGTVNPVWSNSGKTVTIAPPEGLAGNQEYTVTILPNGVHDVEGNGNASTITVTFTTSAAGLMRDALHR